MKNDDEPEKALSRKEVLRVVFGSEVLNIDQHKLASLYGINSGRIAEACAALSWAAENHKTLYRHVSRLNKRKKAKTAEEIEADIFANTVKYIGIK
jgi:hypothetical protein